MRKETKGIDFGASVGTANSMALDMSNIDEAGKQKLNQVAMEGEVGEHITA